MSRILSMVLTMIFLSIIPACDRSEETSSTGSAGVPEGMVLIPAGEFLMGSPEGEGEMYERPQHRVYLDAYYMDKFEVTNAQYRKFCDATGKPHPPNPPWDDNYFLEKPNHPVRNVSWKDTNAYASWAEKRLPTEAEWEKAARGTDGRKYPWGNELPSAGGKYRANYDCYDSGDGTDHDIFLRDGYEYTSPVGSFENGNSPYGICDMAGNAREWCQDWYDEDYYKTNPASNPKGPPSGRYHVIRGGSCFSNASNIRSAFRGNYVPGLVATSGGFRCATDL